MSSAMEIDDGSDQILPRFSMNGQFRLGQFYKAFSQVCCGMCVQLLRFWLFFFTVLQLMKTSQAQHGLRRGDYDRYR